MTNELTRAWAELRRDTDCSDAQFQRYRDRIEAALAARSEPETGYLPGMKFGTGGNELARSEPLDKFDIGNMSRAEQEGRSEPPKQCRWCAGNDTEGHASDCAKAVYDEGYVDALRAAFAEREANTARWFEAARSEPEQQPYHPDRSPEYWSIRAANAEAALAECEAARSEPRAEGLSAHLWPTESGHRLAPKRCADLMPTDADCDCGERQYRRILAAAPPAPALDVERLGFDDLLTIGERLLEHYPPHTIICTHNPGADIGARTTAAIGDLIASCRAAIAPEQPDYDDEPLDEYPHVAGVPAEVPEQS
jgi:hypothetical protein